MGRLILHHFLDVGMKSGNLIEGGGGGNHLADFLSE